MTDRLAKQRRGWLFYGCLACAALMVVLLAAAFGVLLSLRKTINNFTETAPAPVPMVRVSAAQLEQLQRRIEAFEETVQARRSAAPLLLSAEDINALIATRPDAAPLRGKLYVSLAETHLNAQVSVPLSEIGLPVQGRYLNGVATFGLALDHGALRLNVESIRVKGKLLPRLYLDTIRKQNLARNIIPDPHSPNLLDRLEAIEVRNGNLVLVPKAD